MRYAFLVDTPVQVLNSLLYIYGNQIASQSDIFIVNQFNSAQELSERLKKSNDFNNVVLINKPKETFLKHFMTIFSLAFPRLYVSRVLKINIKSFYYDSVFLSVSTKIFDVIVAATKCKNIIGIDDGIGSYFRDTFMGLATSKYSLVRKLFGRGYYIKEMYLNSPEFYIGSEKYILGNLPKIENLDKKKQNRIYEIFRFTKTDLYNKRKVIYLNQPMEDMCNNYLEFELNLARKLNNCFKEDFVVRIHPRETNICIYGELQKDNEGNMWELVAGNDITDNHVLIGVFSTAQFTPKFMYDKEPTVVFTFDLYDGIDDDLIKGFMHMANILKNSYRNKNKVIVLNTIEELGDVCSI